MEATTTTPHDAATERIRAFYRDRLVTLLERIAGDQGDQGVTELLAEALIERRLRLARILLATLEALPADGDPEAEDPILAEASHTVQLHDARKWVEHWERLRDHPQTVVTKLRQVQV